MRRLVQVCAIVLITTSWTEAQSRKLWAGTVVVQSLSVQFPWPLGLVCVSVAEEAHMQLDLAHRLQLVLEPLHV